MPAVALNQRNLLGNGRKPPLYDRGKVGCGIVHLGVGSFHRAHQAVYVDQMLKADPSWGIIGASLISPAMRDALAQQDFLYGLVVLENGGRRCEVISSLMDCVHVPSSLGGVLRKMTDPAIRLVTLTVTEKGYCHRPATGELDLELVRADLDSPHSPSTAVGLITRALMLRREAGVDAFAVLSCDNLSDNGRVLGGLVTAFAGEVDKDLAGWIENNVRFPSCMVDRITPSTTDDDRDFVEAELGLRDNWPVRAEEYSQSVVERFEGPQPPCAEAGVEVVDSVKPYEDAKLRILNGSHFALAHLGIQLGHKLVSSCTRDEGLMGFVRGMLDSEITPTLTGANGVDVPAYIDATLGRFGNENIGHRLSQICQDGSLKLGPRVITPLRENLLAGRASPCLELVLASWLAHWHITFKDRFDATPDPMAKKLEEQWNSSSGKVDRFVGTVVADEDGFGDLHSFDGLVGRVSQAVYDYLDDPVAAMAKACRTDGH